MDDKYKLLKRIGITFFIALLLELTVFNFRFYQSLFYKPVENVSLGVFEDEMESLGNNVYRLKKDTVNLEFLNLNEKINNLYIDIETVNTELWGKDRIEVVPYYTDEGNKLYKQTVSRYVVHDVPLSQYINFNTSGVSEKIRLEINANANDEIKIHNIGINVCRPLTYSIARILVVFVFLSLIFALKAPYILGYKVNDSREQRLFVILLVILQLFFIFHCTTRNEIWDKFIASWHNQYRDLTISMVDNKQLHLQEEPPQFLVDMDNPYDTQYRNQLSDKYGEDTLWDRVYYNGHYYVYFGVVPVLMLYIPFYLLTGMQLSNSVAILFYLFVFTIFSFMLIGEVIKRWFKDTPFIYYVLFSLLMVNCTNMLYVSQYPGIYIVPITAAVAFTVTGLYFWISSLRNNGVSWWRMLLGSLSLALVAGCRPQLLLMSFTAIILFWNTAFKDRLLFSKKGVWNTVCLVLPYVVVAAFIMWYNNARFGSPFDFGANYNLTTNDMTHRGIKLDRVFSGIFYGLFQPPEITAVFPFVKDTYFTTNYVGTTITEDNFGGFISCNIIVYIIFFVGKFKDRLKKKGLYVFTLYTIISAFVINIADTQGAGILQRYICDYGFLLMLATVILLLCIIEKTIRSRLNAPVYNFILLGVILSLLYNLLLMNNENTLAIVWHNSKLYYNIYHLVQFWL